MEWERQWLTIKEYYDNHGEHKEASLPVVSVDLD